VEIAAVKNHRDVARLMGRADLGIESPLNIGVKVDEKDPNRYIVGISQAGLSLPDRDYYLQDDPVLGEIRKKFLVHLERMLRLGGSANANVEAKLFLMWSRKLRGDIGRRRSGANRELTNNLRTRDQLDKLAGNYPWTEILAARACKRSASL